ncbi:MAG: leucyl/phenylalanyl-tRNA--protein transferase [Gammaproteobacteria bacterium]|nr:leucyl/phenylalanyl-tRNA--protein transferase [Gammaproteobacteria bacterium]
MKHLHWIAQNDKTHAFPAVEQAFRDPNGLLAAGGDLAPARLIKAYRNGIFPWYGEGEPILWWSPDPRAVLFPQRLKISRSLHKTLRKGEFTVTMDTAFRQVMQACATPRGDGMGTWITQEMIEAYSRLHEMGIAHSVEAWRNGELAGGLYGVALGRMFFGESMFSRATDASKVAFAHLVRQLERWGYAAIDCQVHSAHLQTLGAEQIDRAAFISLLEQWCDQPGHPGPWRLDDDIQA